MELAGAGSANLRLIPTDAGGAMRDAALRAAIAADLRAGLTPFLVVGTAGTVNIGAFDPLPELAQTAADHGLWFHVDGAFGALAALSEALRPRLAGIDRADSVALDFHKWAHVPYDAGFLLVRDGRCIAPLSRARPPICSAFRAALRRAASGLAISVRICRVDSGR